MIVASYPIRAQQITIGRSPGNAICLDDPRASRVHATVTLREGGAVLEDLGSANPTRVNEQPVSEWRLRSGDAIRVGRSVLLYLAGGAGGRAPKEAFGSVIARQDGGGTIKVPLTEQPFLIGRIEQANIQLQGELIRHCHAIIVAHPRSADLILLTAQPPRAIALADGATISCGTVTLSCHLTPLQERPEKSSDEQPLIVYPVADEKPAPLPKPTPGAAGLPATSPAGKPPKPPKPKPAPSIHLDLKCGTVTIMSMLRKDARRAESDEEYRPLIAPGLVPDEAAAIQPETEGGLKLTVMKGRGVGETYPVKSGRCLVGADVRCDIRLTDEGVAPRHVALLTRLGQLVAEDLGGSGGTFVNGRSIRTRPLGTGDTIRVGECELLVHM
jgi:pSer/pThr/pTyr-binding forkhead associated (FHA) protein